MNNKQAGIVVAVLLLGLVAWLVYWFVANHEREYREVRTGVSAEARRNPFLAAERFLRELGLESESIPGREYLLRPPDEAGVLLVNRLSPNLTPAHEQSLLEWMESGGHLIVTPNRAWEEEDEGEGRGNPLLERFGVRLRIRCACPEPEGPEQATDSGEDSKEDDAAEGDDSYPPLPISIQGYKDPVRVAFQSSRMLEESGELADRAVEGDEGAHLLQFEIGQGLLTVLSDHRFLLNDHIGELDHALFLALLTEGERRVWLLYSSRMPSLFSLLWRAAPFLVLSALALGAFWLWSLTLRSGPLLPRETRVRRNLLEHLDAAANYAWQTDRAVGMFRGSQRILEQAWRQRYPALDRLEREQRCARIAELAGLAAPMVETALYGRVDNEQGFIRASAVQQQLLARISAVGSLSAPSRSRASRRADSGE